MSEMFKTALYMLLSVTHNVFSTVTHREEERHIPFGIILLRLSTVDCSTAVKTEQPGHHARRFPINHQLLTKEKARSISIQNYCTGQPGVAQHADRPAKHNNYDPFCHKEHSSTLSNLDHNESACDNLGQNQSDEEGADPNEMQQESFAPATMVPVLLWQPLSRTDAAVAGTIRLMFRHFLIPQA
jgi:hypothetical protein